MLIAGAPALGVLTAPVVAHAQSESEAELRHEAEAALRPKFDIKAYDDLVVGEGSVPLTVPERSADDWIARVK